MGDAELKLIEKNETIDLYNMQKVLLDRIKHSFNIQDIIRLALLQTLAPIGDYFSAVEILHKYLGQDKSYRLEIIGAYLTSLWIDNKNEFVSYLLQDVDKTNNQIQSLIYFLKALDLYYKGENDPKEYLKKSIQLCDKYVNNIKLYAEYVDDQDYKLILYQKAEENIKEVKSIKEIEREDAWRFIDPQEFIDEFITGVIANEGEHFKS